MLNSVPSTGTYIGEILCFQPNLELFIIIIPRVWVSGVDVAEYKQATLCFKPASDLVALNGP